MDNLINQLKLEMLHFNNAVAKVNNKKVWDKIILSIWKSIYLKCSGFQCEYIWWLKVNLLNCWNIFNLTIHFKENELIILEVET